MTISKRKMSLVKCATCGKKYYKLLCHIKRVKESFCSKECLGKSRGRALKKRLIGDLKLKEKFSMVGKLYAEKRWKNHIRKTPFPTGKKRHAYTIEQKRFTNMRYKARKRKAEGSHTFGEWQLLKKQYGNICPACGRGEPKIKLTEDHIIPLSKGGSDFIENVQPLCVSCNTRKHTKVIKYHSLIIIGKRLGVK